MATEVSTSCFGVKAVKVTLAEVVPDYLTRATLTGPNLQFRTEAALEVIALGHSNLVTKAYNFLDTSAQCVLISVGYRLDDWW